MIDDLLKKYPNDLRVVIKQFPLSFHKQARKASLYALAAERQGKYMEMSNKIFENYRGLKSNEDLPLQIAGELGLDLEQLNRDMNDETIDALIRQEYEQLKSLSNSYETDKYAGVRLAVPKFFINGR